MASGNEEKRRLDGGCLCGAVRYSVADDFAYAANCHCSKCRRATGAAFKSFAGIAGDKLAITEGETNLLIFGDATACDVHCGTCGSLLFSSFDNGARVHLLLGTLAAAPGIRPTKHIFVGSKAPWFEITDDLPQYDGHAPAGS